MVGETVPLTAAAVVAQQMGIQRGKKSLPKISKEIVSIVPERCGYRADGALVLTLNDCLILGDKN